MKILVADDDEWNLSFIVSLINKRFHSGVTVIEAVNGQQAVTQAREHSPDLILMDIQMPVMDGIEAMKTLKSEPHTSGIPIIAVTGYAVGSHEENRELFLNEGFDSYISKPFQVMDFFAEVENHISDRKIET